MNHRRNDKQGTQALCDPPAVACTKATTPASPLRYYGGLQSFARKIVGMLPPHDFYIEPFAGGLSVLLAKSASATEIVSDINADLINYWQIVQRPSSRLRLLQQLEMTPYSRALFKECIGLLEDGGGDSLLRAWAMAVAQNQSRNGHGVDWSYGRGSNANAESWARLPARLEQAGRRLRRVRIECQPYQNILQCFDSRRAVVLLDPPFLPSTRVSAEVYRHEFTNADHQRLLKLVVPSKAKMVIFGYENDLYAEALAAWNRVEMKGRSFANPCGSGGRRPTRTLVLWANFDLPAGSRMQKRHGGTRKADRAVSKALRRAAAR